MNLKSSKKKLRVLFHKYPIFNLMDLILEFTKILNIRLLVILSQLNNKNDLKIILFHSH